METPLAKGDIKVIRQKILYNKFHNNPFEKSILVAAVDLFEPIEGLETSIEELMILHRNIDRHILLYDRLCSYFWNTHKKEVHMRLDLTKY